LFQHGFAFDFFQAVRLLAHLRAHASVGGTPAPSAESVRFRALPSLEFPASAIHSIEEDGGGPPYMTVAFLGLVGPKGVLPTHYTEAAIDEDRSGRSALTEFLDIFNHRLISLFYKAWEKHRPLVGHERAQRAHTAEDSFTSYMFDLIGMGTEGLRDRLRVTDLTLLRYAGLLAQRPHSATALAGMLSDYFQVPVEVEQYCGRWRRLDEGDRCYLRAPAPSNRLGMGAVAGDAVWLRQSLFRVRIGPLTLARFREFLPDGKAFAEAVSMIRLFAGPTLEFEIQPVLKAEEVPWCEMQPDSGFGPRLGWCGWLKAGAFERDAADAVFAGGETDGKG
jgi:type VI secretion system protein ImpH